jgi:hypothetical protein
MTMLVPMWPCTVKDIMYSMHWKVMDHPPYSPDLPLCDFHVFSPLKKVLKDHRFGLDEDVKTLVMQFSTSSPGSSLQRGSIGRCVNLSQYPWELFLMASTPLPRTIPNEFHLNKPHIHIYYVHRE